MSDIRAVVNDSTLYAGSEGNPMALTASKRGELVVIDWLQKMAMNGRAYQVRAGTISVPVVGDVLITDTAAEMTADAPTGTTIIPVGVNINFNLAAATLFETAGKSVGAVSTAGTAFVPLPLKIGGAASTATARAQNAGACTVAAEVTTTTRRHFAWGHPIAAGAWPTIYDWKPSVFPVLTGPAAFYVQIGADTTGPSYYASIDFVELPSANV